MKFLKNKSNKLILFVSIIISLYIIGSLISGFDMLFFIKLPEATIKLFDRYFAPDFTSVTSPTNLLKEAISTILISATATLFGALISIVMVIIGMRDSKNKIMYRICILIGSAFRNIPQYIWALLLLFFMWYGTFVAFLALMIGTVGFLVRTYMDTFGEYDASKKESLVALGASPMQVIFKGVIPDSSPSLISWMLYSFEVNVRSATLVGMITSGGLGYLLEVTRGLSYIDNPNKYNMQMAVILTILLLVVLINIAVNKVRERLV